MVDVGANIGALTFGVAAFNYSVLAFEPMLVNVAGAASGHGLAAFHLNLLPYPTLPNPHPGLLYIRHGARDPRLLQWPEL